MIFIPDCKDTDHRATPEWLKQAIWDRFNGGQPMYDPCPLSPTEDGLKRDWAPKTYVNPPFSRGLQKIWVKKCIEQQFKGRDIYLLLKCDTSTELFHDLILPNVSLIYAFDCRVQFTDAGTPSFDTVLYNFAYELHDACLMPFKVKHLRETFKKLHK